MSKKYYNYKKRCKYIKKTNKSKVEILLIILTIILSISQIFGIFYPVFSNLYSSVNKFLRRINMVIFSLILLSAVVFISYFTIKTILEYLYKKREKFLNMKFGKYFLINIIFVGIVFILLFQTGISFFIYFSYEITTFDIYLIILILIPFTLVIFFYSYTEIEIKYRQYKYNLFNETIKYISNSKLILFSIIFSAIIINTVLYLKNYNLPYELNALENKTNLEEKIRNYDEIKLRLIIDKLLEKIDIEITDEEIELEKNKKLDKLNKILDNTES